jgi:hypothetical protein
MHHANGGRGSTATGQSGQAWEILTPVEVGDGTISVILTQTDSAGGQSLHASPGLALQDVIIVR